MAHHPATDLAEALHLVEPLIAQKASTAAFCDGYHALTAQTTTGTSFVTVRVHLPVRFNDGEPVPAMTFAEILADVYSVATGYTLYTANGQCLSPSLAVETDSHLVLEVVTDEVAFQALRGLMHLWAERLKQRELFGTVTVNVRPLFVPPSAKA